MDTARETVLGGVNRGSRGDRVAGSDPDRANRQSALERLRDEIVAIERRGSREAPDGGDDPQAARWFGLARRAAAAEEDSDHRRPIRQGHSFQERLREARPPDRRTESSHPVPETGIPFLRTGWPEIDSILGGFPSTGVHELFGLEWDPPGEFRDRSSRTNAWIPPMGVAIRIASILVRSEDLHERGAVPRGALWIGRAIRPDPEAIVLADRSVPDPSGGPCGMSIERSVFLDVGDGPSVRAAGRNRESLRGSLRAWAIEQALRHRAFAVIVADGRGFTVAECRRLQVAAAGRSPPTPVLLLREPREISGRSVASFRWRVEPCIAADGGSAWRLRLVHGRWGALSRAGPTGNSGVPPGTRERIESEQGLAATVGAGSARVGWAGSVRSCAG